MIALGTTIAAFGGLSAVAISTTPGPLAQATPVAAVNTPTTTVRTEVVHRTVHVPSTTAAQRTATAVPTTAGAPVLASTVQRVSDDRRDDATEDEPGDDRGGDRGRNNESEREHDDD